ncbi:hypothetical protein M422DRAFT_242816 [Sphaerobolus stellatus SS14]|nr:hypothetical protein M422DRAFT_242816 [Sphaerobolus stellatus SS14]
MEGIEDNKNGSSTRHSSLSKDKRNLPSKGKVALELRVASWCRGADIAPSNAEKDDEIAAKTHTPSSFYTSLKPSQIKAYRQWTFPKELGMRSHSHFFVENARDWLQPSAFHVSNKDICDEEIANLMEYREFPNVNHANNILETRHSCPAKHPPRQAWDPPSFPGLAEQVQLLEAPEILTPPTYQLRRRHLPEYLPGLLASAHSQPRNSIRLAQALPPSLSALCGWDGRMDDSSSTSTSDDGSEPDTALSASGSVAAAGSALGLGDQVNSARGPATSFRFDDPVPGSSSGMPHNTTTVMSAPGSTSDGSGCWDGSFEGTSDAGTKAAASNPADMKTTNI